MSGHKLRPMPVVDNNNGIVGIIAQGLSRRVFNTSPKTRCNR